LSKVIIVNFCYFLRKEKQAIQDFEKKLGEGESKKKMGTLTRWITLKRKTDKNNQVCKNKRDYTLKKH
jgi:hypothetical protein